MLQISELYGTKLTIGPRLQEFIDAGYADEILWSEKYPGQEDPTPDGRGEFQHTREWIETATMEKLFDLWCRGQNLFGFAPHILRAIALFDRIFKKSAQ